MKPKIVHRDQLLLVGFGFFGDPFAASGGWTEENEIGRLWNRFMTYLQHQGDRVRHIADPNVCYEVHLMHGETAATGNFEVFVGVKVVCLEELPVEVLVKVLPPTTYAVFTLKGKQITADWSRMIYTEWMPQSGYREAYPFTFQLYDRRFKGLDQLAGSELDVYVPVEK
jgi:predicted transcriptional regulator YdeE